MADILPRVEAVADEDVEDSWEVLADAGVDGKGADKGIFVMRGRERLWGDSWEVLADVQVCGLDGERGEGGPDAVAWRGWRG